MNNKNDINIVRDIYNKWKDTGTNTDYTKLEDLCDFIELLEQNGYTSDYILMQYLERDYREHKAKHTQR